MSEKSEKGIQIIALDLETAGLVPGRHVPLSIGAVKIGVDEETGINDSNSFYMQLNWDSFLVDTNALSINRLDIANPPSEDGPFYNRSLLGYEGVKAFAEWLGKSDDMSFLAMGKNVGSFDLPMLKSIWREEINISTDGHSLSPGKWPFHYRSIDLNTLFVTLSRLTNLTLDEVKGRISKRSWEKQAHYFDEAKIPLICKEHNALADAWWNVYAWQECLQWFNDLRGK